MIQQVFYVFKLKNGSFYKKPDTSAWNRGVKFLSRNAVSCKSVLQATHFDKPLKDGKGVETQPYCHDALKCGHWVKVTFDIEVTYE